MNHGIFIVSTINIDASLIIEFIRGLVLFVYYPPATEASKEVANLKERKNSHTHVQEFVTLSVCLSVCPKPLNPIISGLAEQYGLKFVGGHLCPKINK